MSEELIAEGQRIMTICNSCRYCEGFCAVFPAMERRLTFAEADMNYLANLCHNCSECLYACQYSPPHAFAVNLPRTLAEIRVRSYEKYCWPAAFGTAFRRHGITSVLGFAAALFLCMLGATLIAGTPALVSTSQARFYAVVPHGVMAGAFGAVFLFIVATLVVGLKRYVRDTAGAEPQAPAAGSVLAGLRDAMTLKNLHASGEDCTGNESLRSPWRRWFHHLTFYGFLLCFAATCVATVYHFALHREAPYPLMSTPVLLGTAGGLGLLIGPVGLWASRARRDPDTMDPAQSAPDRAFILLLVLTSASGLLLLALRDSAGMGLLLLAHLAIVMTLFVTLPYGKFVHGLYRTAALIRHARETH